MLYDFILTDQTNQKPLYCQIYYAVRQAIEKGSLKKGERLPSIRGLSTTLSVSKTTVIAAYDRLCAEGYITNRPQSGFFVAADFENHPRTVENIDHPSKKENKFYEYDFSTKSIDSNIIDLAVWRKEIKNVINRSYLMTSYGDAQGEEALRYALQKYALGIRSVNATADNIVVGAGTQAILFLLCSLLGCRKRVALQKSSFVQSEYVFRSFGYDVCYFESDDYGVTMRSLESIKPDLILINPNFSGKKGTNMPVTHRIDLIRWVEQHNALIVEDDFNGELRYSSHPIPCVQHYGAKHTVYIGSFSKVLLPSVRIGYMVLPEQLMKAFRKKKGVSQPNRLQNRTTCTCCLPEFRQNGCAHPPGTACLSRKKPPDNHKRPALFSAGIFDFPRNGNVHLAETSAYRQPQSRDVRIEKKQYPPDGS